MSSRPIFRRVDISGQLAALLRPDLLLVLAALAITVLLTYPALEALMQRWLLFDQAYSHGLFVLAVSIFLTARLLRRQEFALDPALSGIAFAALTAFGLALVSVVNIQVLQQAGAVVLLWALINAMVGWRAGLHFLIPIGFLFYAIPLWDYLTPPLVWAAVVANDILLGVRGIHFHVEGIYIRLLDIGIFEIADGCSGLRYLVVALTLATLFSTLNFRHVRDWIALHAAAIGLALLVNWVRIFIIILVGYETRMESGLIDDHEFFGWVLFAITLVPFFLLANWMMNRRPEPPAPVRQALPRHAHASTPRLAVALVSLTALTLLPSFLLSAPFSQTTDIRLQAPERLGPLEQTANGDDAAWQPILRGSPSVLRQSYSDGENTAHLGLWHYADQRQGSELVQHGNRLVEGGTWQVIHRDTLDIDGTAWQTMVLEHRLAGYRKAVLWSYNVAGAWTTGNLEAKALLLRGAFQGRRDGTLFSLNARCHEPDCATTVTELADALESIGAGDLDALVRQGNRTSTASEPTP